MDTNISNKIHNCICMFYLQLCKCHQIEAVLLSSNDAHLRIGFLMVMLREMGLSL